MNPSQLLNYFDKISDAPDAVSRLRRFILDLAVRGKLIDQDPRDEPACELLKRIQVEKTQLVRDGTIRSPRAADAIEEGTMPFSLPHSWIWCRLSEVGAIVGGGTPPSGDTNNFAVGGTGIAWLTPADLGKHTELYVSHGARDLTPQGLHSSSATVMPKGSVLFTSRAPIGYTAIAANEVSTNQGFKSVVPYIPECNLFIAIYFRAFGKWINDKASGTTFREVSGKIVSSLPFPLPPLAEQHRIATKVTELMTLCDRIEAAREDRESRRDLLVTVCLHHLNNRANDDAFREHARFFLRHLPQLTVSPSQIPALRQIILSLAIRGQLVRQDIKDESVSGLLKCIAEENVKLQKSKNIRPQKSVPPAESFETETVTPKTWIHAYLQDLAYQITDGTHLTPTYTNTGKPFLSAQNVKPFRFMPEKHRFVSIADFENYRSNRKPERDDVLVTRVGAGIGEAAVIDSDFEFAFYVSLCLIKIPTRFLNPKYLVLWLNSPEGRRSSTIRTYGKGASQGNLNLGLIRTFKVPLPPLAEQHRIVARVAELISLCDQLEVQLGNTQSESGRLLESVLHHTLKDGVRSPNDVQAVSAGDLRSL